VRVGMGGRATASVFALLFAASTAWGGDAPGPMPADVSAEASVELPALEVCGRSLDAARERISPDLGATCYTLDADRIAGQAQGAEAPFDQTFYRFPGVAQDELDKRLHVRGEEADLQYRIDGLVIPDGLSVFGQELTTRYLSAVSLITGTLPAQYGGRTAGIVDLKTKQGADLGGGALSLYGGANATVEPSLEYGGAFGRFSGYGLFSYLQDGLGMANPDADFLPDHDQTRQWKGFGEFSWVPDAESRLTLIVSGDVSSFQIPNIPGQTIQYPFGQYTNYDSSAVNENQREQAWFEILAWQKSGPGADFQVSQSTRYSDAHFLPDTTADLLFNGVASDADHRLTSENVNVDGSVKLARAHTARGGVSVSLQRAEIDTLDTVLPASWDSGSGTWDEIPGGLPTTITDDYTKDAVFIGGYLQDDWRPSDRIDVNAGLRYDLWSAYLTESQWSPRLNATWTPDAVSAVHIGYGRYFTPPPLELIQAGDLSKFDGTTNGVDPALKDAPAVESERYHYFDAGVTRDFWGHTLHSGVDAYFKLKTGVLDEGQFGPAMIFSPNNAAYGRTWGVEWTLSWERDGFEFWNNLTRSQTMAYGLLSGQWQFSEQEVSYMQDHWYHLDHDQDWTGSAGVSYKRGGTRVYADLLYGSGLYSGFCNDTEMPAYATANVGAEQDFKIFKLRMDVLNIADTSYEIREGDGIGVFAPQYLPRFGVYTGISVPL